MNWERLIELREEVGDEALNEVVGLFLEETDAAADRLAHAGPHSDLAEDMHFLKGAALNMGFDDLASLCATVEKQARMGPVDPGPVLESYRSARAALLAGAPRLGLRL